MIQDRVDCDSFPLTHEFLSYMLGVRRASVSEVAATFQKSGLIDYHRGQMTIRDRQGLSASLTFPVKSWNLQYEKVSVKTIIIIKQKLMIISNEEMSLPEDEIQAGFFSHKDNGKSQPRHEYAVQLQTAWLINVSTYLSAIPLHP